MQSSTYRWNDLKFELQSTEIFDYSINFDRLVTFCVDRFTLYDLDRLGSPHLCIYLDSSIRHDYLRISDAQHFHVATIGSLYPSKVLIWDISNGAPLLFQTIINSPINIKITQIEWKNDHEIACVSVDGRIKVWDIGSKEMLASLSVGGEKELSKLEWHPTNNNRLLLCLNRQYIIVWDIQKHISTTQITSEERQGESTETAASSTAATQTTYTTTYQIGKLLDPIHDIAWIALLSSSSSSVSSSQVWIVDDESNLCQLDLNTLSSSSNNSNNKLIPKIFHSFDHQEGFMKSTYGSKENSHNSNSCRNRIKVHPNGRSLLCAYYDTKKQQYGFTVIKLQQQIMMKEDTLNAEEEKKEAGDGGTSQMKISKVLPQLITVQEVITLPSLTLFSSSSSSSSLAVSFSSHSNNSGVKGRLSSQQDHHQNSCYYWRGERNSILHNNNKLLLGSAVVAVNNNAFSTTNNASLINTASFFIVHRKDGHIYLATPWITQQPIMTDDEAMVLFHQHHEQQQQQQDDDYYHDDDDEEEYEDEDHYQMMMSSSRSFLKGKLGSYHHQTLEEYWSHVPDDYVMKKSVVGPISFIALLKEEMKALDRMLKNKSLEYIVDRSMNQFLRHVTLELMIFMTARDPHHSHYSHSSHHHYHHHGGGSGYAYQQHHSSQHQQQQQQYRRSSSYYGTTTNNKWSSGGNNNNTTMSGNNLLGNLSGGMSGGSINSGTSSDLLRLRLTLSFPKKISQFWNVSLHVDNPSIYKIDIEALQKKLTSLISEITTAKMKLMKSQSIGGGGGTGGGHNNSSSSLVATATAGGGSVGGSATTQQITAASASTALTTSVKKPPTTSSSASSVITTQPSTTASSSVDFLISIAQIFQSSVMEIKESVLNLERMNSVGSAGSIAEGGGSELGLGNVLSNTSTIEKRVQTTPFPVLSGGIFNGFGQLLLFGSASLEEKEREEKVKTTTTTVNRRMQSNSEWVEQIPSTWYVSSTPMASESGSTTKKVKQQHCTYELHREELQALTEKLQQKMLEKQKQEEELLLEEAEKEVNRKAMEEANEARIRQEMLSSNNNHEVVKEDKEAAIAEVKIEKQRSRDDSKEGQKEDEQRKVVATEEEREGNVTKDKSGNNDEGSVDDDNKQPSVVDTIVDTESDEADWVTRSKKLQQRQYQQEQEQKKKKKLLPVNTMVITSQSVLSKSLYLSQNYAISSMLSEDFDVLVCLYNSTIVEERLLSTINNNTNQQELNELILLWKLFYTCLRIQCIPNQETFDDSGIISWSQGGLGRKLYRKLIDYVLKMKDSITISTLISIIGGIPSMLTLWKSTTTALTSSSTSPKHQLLKQQQQPDYQLLNQQEEEYFHNYCSNILYNYSKMLYQWNEAIQASYFLHLLVRYDSKFFFLYSSSSPVNTTSTASSSPLLCDFDQNSTNYKNKLMLNCQAHCFLCEKALKKEMTLMKPNFSSGGSGGMNSRSSRHSRMVSKNRNNSVGNNNNTSSTSSQQDQLTKQAIVTCDMKKFNCAVCHKLVPTAMISICIFCGHGGHDEHVKAWFATSDQCPLGCGCKCRNLLKKMTVDDDELSVDEAIAVSPEKSLESFRGANFTVDGGNYQQEWNSVIS